MSIAINTSSCDTSFYYASHSSKLKQIVASCQFVLQSIHAKGPAGGTKHSSGKLFKVKAHHRLIVNLNTRFDGFAG